MKRIGKSGLCLLLVLALLLVPGAAQPEETEGKQYIVRRWGEAPPQPPDVVGEEELQALLRAGAVAWYEEDREVFLPDPEPTLSKRGAALQGNLSPWYSDDMWHLYMVGADTVYERGALGQGLRVGIIDSGINPHEALEGRLAPGWNYVDGTADTGDSVNHGTRVAGLIAGRRVDGMLGVAPEATLVPLKCFTAKKGGDLSDICTAILEGVSRFDCDILNLSFGFPSDSAALQEAVGYAVSQGVLVVASAGNTASAAYYPALYDTVVSVGGVDETGEVYAGSSRRSHALLAAPGVRVLCADYQGGYAWGTGTSFSAPVVSGAAAALWSLAPWLSAGELMQLLGSTALDRGDEGWDAEYGWGILDLRAAVEALDESLPEEPAGVFLSLSEGDASAAQVRNRCGRRMACLLLAAEYDPSGRQRSVTVTPLSLAPGETLEVSVPEAPCRLFLCSRDWRPLSSALDVPLPEGG